jgi:hypothetical protein
MKIYLTLVLSLFSFQAYSLPTNCKAFVTEGMTRVIQRFARGTPTASYGFYVDKTFPSQDDPKAVCFQGGILNINTYEVLRPIEGCYRENEIEFFEIYDPARYERFDFYKGNCDTRGGAEGEVLNQDGRKVGTFFLSF